MKIKQLLNILAGCSIISGCSADPVLQSKEEGEAFSLQAEIVPFEGEAVTRASMDGKTFETGDWIRLKIICPFSGSQELGESTYSGSFDAFYLLKKTGTNSWGPLESSDKCDISGTYSYSGSPYPGNGGNYVQVQQTPYVYMASTWSEEKSFRSPQGLVLQYCHVFHADQRDESAYKASDLLWAQQYMQTGSWNVKLSFRHVMSRLVFTINDDELTDKISADAVLTLEGMPDIDQQEIVVGDYYAARSKINSRYGYRQKAYCSYDNNGKVLGIGVNDDTKQRAYTYPLSGSPANTPYDQGTFVPSAHIIPNTGTYTAHKTALKQYCMIVPPCKLDAVDATHKAQLWLRDGGHRYKMELDRTEFVEGTSYDVTMKLLKSSTAE